MIFKNWMVEGRVVAGRSFWNLWLQARRGIGGLDFGTEGGEGRRWGEWTDLECVLEIILTGLNGWPGYERERKTGHGV